MHQSIAIEAERLPSHVLGVAGHWSDRDPNTSHADLGFHSGYDGALLVTATRYSEPGRLPFWIVSVSHNVPDGSVVSVALERATTLEEAEELVRQRLDLAAEVREHLRTLRSARAA